MAEQSEDYKKLIDPWVDPRPATVRDARQTFIIKGQAVPGQKLSREYGFPIADLSLVDLTELARTGVTLLIHYEPGYHRTTLKPIPTLEVIKAAPKMEVTKQCTRELS